VDEQRGRATKRAKRMYMLAADREGTPEGDIALLKFMILVARYELTDSELGLQGPQKRTEPEKPSGARSRQQNVDDFETERAKWGYYPPGTKRTKTKPPVTPKPREFPYRIDEPHPVTVIRREGYIENCCGGCGHPFGRIQSHIDELERIRYWESFD